MLLAYEYRLMPTAAQRQAFACNAGACRWLYNRWLAERIEHYKETGGKTRGGPGQYSQQGQIPKLKKEFEWLKDCESTSLQIVAGNLETAYQNFFRRVREGKQAPGFPKFKKKGVRDSFTCSFVTNNIQLWSPEDDPDFGSSWNQIKLPKHGWCKMVLHRKPPENSKIKRVTVKKHSDGNWYVSILFETPEELPELVSEKKALKNSVGIDLGLSSFAVLSNGQRFQNPKFYEAGQRKLARLQRKLSRKTPGSNNRAKAKLKVSKQHFHVAQQRLDFVRKRAFRIARDFDLITVENLNVSGMKKTRCLSKAISDSGWGLFISQLRWQCAKHGKHLVVADRWFASSKISYYTGEKNSELTLADRSWTDSAGNVLDRDLNAAWNLDYVGQHYLQTGELLTTKSYMELYQ